MPLPAFFELGKVEAPPIPDAKDLDPAEEIEADNATTPDTASCLTTSDSPNPTEMNAEAEALLDGQRCQRC